MGVGGPLGFSDLMFVVNTKYYILLLTSGKWDGEDIAVLGKVLYSNGWIFFFFFGGSFFPVNAFFLFAQVLKISISLTF